MAIPYIIKSYRAGVSEETDKGVAGSFKYGYGLDIHKRLDSLTSKQAMATILGSGATGTTLTGIFKWFVQGMDGTTYCFGANGSIFTRDGDGVWTFVYNDENGDIRGATDWKQSDGSYYLYWATATSLARKPLQGSPPSVDTSLPSLVREARWTDVTADYKTTLNDVPWHTMKMASGQVAIANGESLGSIEFDGDFVASSLNIRPGNLIKAIEERDDYTILGSERQDNSEEGHLWSWLTTATNYIQKKRIPIQGVNALLSTEFSLLQGGDDGEIFLADFNTPVPLITIPGGGKADPGGVSIENDLASFGIYGGSYPGIWSYGRRQKNRPFALNYDYRLAGTVAGSTISTISAVAVIDGLLMASWGATEGSTNDYGVDMVSSTTKATAVYEGLEFNAKAPQTKKFFESIKLTMTPLPNGTSIAVKYKIDHETNWHYAISEGGATTFSTANAVEAEFKITEDGQIYEVGVELNPSSNSTPEILAIITWVEPEQDHG